MTNYKRVSGGEKNSQSGKKWTKEELRLVLNLYINEPNLKIHENNPVVQKFAAEIQRTIRSVEAQLLMFRNLERCGDYGYGNMNKLCKELWIEYINSFKKI